MGGRKNLVGKKKNQICSKLSEMVRKLDKNSFWIFGDPPTPPSQFFCQKKKLFEIARKIVDNYFRIFGTNLPPPKKKGSKIKELKCIPKCLKWRWCQPKIISWRKKIPLPLPLRLRLSTSIKPKFKMNTIAYRLVSLNNGI